MTYQEIKNALENGEQFENNNAGWFTVNRIKENTLIIVKDDEYFFYKNSASYARRVKQLINRGY